MFTFQGNKLMNYLCGVSVMDSISKNYESLCEVNFRKKKYIYDRYVKNA